MDGGRRRKRKEEEEGGQVLFFECILTIITVLRRYILMYSYNPISSMILKIRKADNYFAKTNFKSDFFNSYLRIEKNSHKRISRSNRVVVLASIESGLTLFTHPLIDMSHRGFVKPLRQWLRRHLSLSNSRRIFQVHFHKESIVDNRISRLVSTYPENPSLFFHC